MILDVIFEEQTLELELDFGQVQEINDGGYDRGFEDGHTKGYADGESAGLDIGIEQGKQAEYDRFWDNFQDYGNRTSYYYGFAGRGWTDETFKPKYKIKPTDDASGIFYLNQATTPLTADMVDFSGATSFYNVFRGAQFKEIELIDFSSNNQVLSYTFDSAATEKIGLLIMSEIATAKPNGTTFSKMSNLSHIRIEGPLANIVNFNWSPLDAESIKSVMAAMSDSATGGTAAFKKSAVNAAFETSEDLADGSTSAEWLALVATKPNWTITLA